jgi:hypothetical protein
MVTNTLKSLALLVTFSFCSSAFTQVTTAMKAAQTDGASLANSTGNVVPKDGKALVESGTQQGTNNIMGSRYTGEAPADLTRKINAPSMFNEGDASRITSVNKVQGTYTNQIDKQSDEAVYFLDKKPVRKQTLDKNDAILNPLNYNNDKSPFASSLSRNCTDQVNPTPSKNDFYSCLVTYNPYVYSCTIDNKVSFREVYTACPTSWIVQGNQCIYTSYTTYNANVAYTCESGWTLSGSTCSNTTSTFNTATINYSCPIGQILSGSQCTKPATTCVPGTLLSYSMHYQGAGKMILDPYVHVFVYCAEGGFKILIYSSAYSTPGTPYENYVNNKLFTAEYGKSTSKFLIADIGRGCSYPLYYESYCNGNECTTSTTYKQINCMGTSWLASGKYTIPYVAVSDAATGYSCPTGGTLSGTTCTTTTTTDTSGAPTYSCPQPDILIDKTCTNETTSASPRPTQTVMDESNFNNCEDAQKISK